MYIFFHNRSVCSIYFRALAVMDSILLILMLSRYWAIAQFDYDIGDANMFMCQFHPYLMYWSRDLSGWILTVIAVERYMGVTHPHNTMFTRKRAIGILLVLFVSSALLNIGLPISHGMKEEHNDIESQDYVPMTEGYCCIIVQYHHFIQQIWPYFDLIKQSLLPFLIILTCNANIIYTTIKAKYVRNRDMNSSKHNQSLVGMTVLLISVSIVYLICTLTSASLYIMRQNLVYKYSNIDMPAYIEAESELYVAFAVMSMAINSASNFPLYCLSGPKFRKGLSNLFVAEREMRRKSTRSFSRSTISTNVGSNIYIRRVSTKSDISPTRQLSSSTGKLLKAQTSII